MTVRKDTKSIQLTFTANNNTHHKWQSIVGVTFLAGDFDAGDWANNSTAIVEAQLTLPMIVFNSAHGRGGETFGMLFIAERIEAGYIPLHRPGSLIPNNMMTLGDSWHRASDLVQRWEVPNFKFLFEGKPAAVPVFEVHFMAGTSNGGRYVADPDNDVAFNRVIPIELVVRIDELSK